MRVRGRWYINCKLYKLCMGANFGRKKQQQFSIRFGSFLHGFHNILSCNYTCKMLKFGWLHILSSV